MLFSPIANGFFRSVVDHVRRHHSKRLGSFLCDAFEGALTPANGLGRRQMQALGRELLSEVTSELVQHEPDSLSPLATLVRDTKTSGLHRKKPICCNSMVVKDGLGPAFLRAFVKRWPEEVGAFFEETFMDVKSDEPASFKLFRPLGRKLIGQVNLTNVKDTEQFQAAWMMVKSRSHGPLDFGSPPTEPSPVTPQPKPSAPAPEKPAPAAEPSAPHDLEGIDWDALWDESEDEEPEPKKRGGKRVAIVPEKVENYEGIVCDDNEPAFMTGLDHPTFGKIMVMVAVSGYNPEGQMVYRGGLVYDPQKGKEVTHRYLSSVFDPLTWEDDEGTRMLAKAVPWVRGVYGKYWTNVKRDGETQWGDIESLKRHYILGEFPEIQFVDQETYDRHRRRTRRRRERAAAQAQAHA